MFNKKIAPNCFHCVINAPGIARLAKPGQFVNIRVSDGITPLLRRPLSIHKVKAGNVGLLYEVLGQGTQILAKRKPGEYLDVIGPLGSGFTYQRPTASSERLILIAGGMGTAPLVFLAQRLTKRDVIASPERSEERSNLIKIALSQEETQAPRNDGMIRYSPLVLIGAKSRSHILCEKEFKDLGCQVKIATDNGSRGFKGYVSDLLESELSTVNSQLSTAPARRFRSVNSQLSTVNYELLTIYACGPRPMLEEISRISQEHNVSAQLSLEAHMACGIGACMGCAVRIKKNNGVEYRRVCKDGPVFAAQEIEWGIHGC